MVGAKIKPIFEARAKERMLAGVKIDPNANLPEGCKGQSRDEAAKAVNVSPRSVESTSGMTFCRYLREVKNQSVPEKKAQELR